MPGRLLPVGESTGHFLDTLRALVGREFRMRYKGSFFGLLWTLLTPLGTVAVMQFLFTTVLPLGMPNFAAFMYAGLLPWLWFATSIQTGASTMLDNRDLVRTPFFAKPMLPWSVTCTNFLLYLLALPVLFGLMAVNGIHLTRMVLALPAIWIAQWIITLGLTVLIAALGAVVRDIQHLIGVVLTFWFYFTPIFYDIKQAPPDVGRWFLLNPMAAIVKAHRAVVLEGVSPDWAELGMWTLISSVFLAVSLVVFRELEDTFVEVA